MADLRKLQTVSVEYQAADQILSFYVALESLPNSRIAAVYKCQLTFNKRLFDLLTGDKGL